MKLAFRQMCLVVFGLALPALAQPASAGLVTQTDNYSSPLASFSAPLTFTKFNTQLGTLTGISITLNLTGTVTSQVHSTSSQAQTFTGASSTSTVTATGPDLTVISASLLTTPATGTIGANSTMTIGTDGGTVGSSSTLASYNFSPYESIGAGNFVINAVGHMTNGGSTNSSNVSIFGNSTVGGSLTLSYTYTPAVPAPASLGMVILGLGCLAGGCWIRCKHP
jgi:hypothetical protein